MTSPRMTIHDVFATHSVQRPDALAVQLGTDVMTYGELGMRTDVLASHLLSRGLRPEDRVASSSTVRPR